MNTSWADALILNDNNNRIKEENYYAGYYWGSNPYDWENLSTDKTDDDLKRNVLQNLVKSSIYSDTIVVSIHNGLVRLGGKITTHKERRHIGRIVWNTPGVVKVLNQLSVTDPKTAGPTKIPEHKF